MLGLIQFFVVFFVCSEIMDDGCMENIANRRMKKAKEGTKNPRETVTYPNLFISL